jgi:hypothetical protein
MSCPLSIYFLYLKLTVPKWFIRDVYIGKYPSPPGEKYQPSFEGKI